MSAEWSITVNGLTYRGLRWGEGSTRRILALHGWLDNAESFTRLAQQLPGVDFVAPDLSGHGHTDWRSRDAAYNIWDDLPELVGLLDALDWQDCDLIGHSRGAIISGLLASAFPHRVQRLVLIDAIAAPPADADNLPVQLAAYVADKQANLTRATRVIDSEQHAIRSRAKGALTVELVSAMTLRNLRQHGDGFVWRTDPRLFGASAVKLGDGQKAAVLSGLSMPVKVILAEDDRVIGDPNLDRWLDLIPRVEVQRMAGGHHLHMTQAAEVAHTIKTFLRREEAA